MSIHTALAEGYLADACLEPESVPKNTTRMNLRSLFHRSRFLPLLRRYAFDES